MSAAEVKAKRFRWPLRFSVRTLGIVVTLVCIYFGLWEATKRYGVVEESKAEFRSAPPATNGKHWQLIVVESGGESSPMPLVIRRNAEHGDEKSQYYLWLFGPKIKLPF
jgi:hypothetical protein